MLFYQSECKRTHSLVKSISGKMREYCLVLHWFASVKDGRSIIDNWQRHYNHVRPHRSRGKKPPAEFVKKTA
jgi:putative transposase